MPDEAPALPDPSSPAPERPGPSRLQTSAGRIIRSVAFGQIDRLASLVRWYWLAPLFAIVLFIAVMLAVFYMLRQDELDRQRQMLYRDVQATQQSISARLQSNQDEMLELSRNFAPDSDGDATFVQEARAIMRNHPALMTIAWVGVDRTWRRVATSEVQFDGGPHEEGDRIENAVSRIAFDAARDRRQPRYSAPYAAADGDMYIELHVPLFVRSGFEGTLVAVTSLASLSRVSIPKDAAAKFNVMLVDADGRMLAGKLGAGGLLDPGPADSRVILPLGAPLSEVYLQATAFRTRSQLANNFLVWAVVALSLLIVWTLFSQMRHLRGRREAEATRDGIFNLSLDILAVIDRRGLIARLNPACARILGRDPESLQGVSLLDLVHPDERDATALELQRIFDGGVSSAIENRCRRFNPDGTTEYRWLVWNFNPDVATRGDKRLVYAVAHDITQRRARQYALQAETSFRRAMEDSMLTGMRVLDMEGRITYVNPAFCRMLGYPEHELLGAVAPFPYWPKTPEGQRESASQLQQILAGRTPPAGLEVLIERLDGTYLDTRMYVSPLIDANGVQSGWMTSMTDITQAKRTREELGLAHKRFLTVLDGLDAAVSVSAIDPEHPTDPDDRPLLFANRYYRSLLGDGAHSHHTLRKAQDATLSNLSNTCWIDDRSMQADPLAHEVYSVHADRWFEVRTRIIQWVDGLPVRMQIATDITERKATRERERQQEEKVQLTSRLITMGEMASSLAHELNQPLTAIANYSMGTVARVRNNVAAGMPIDQVELLSMLQKTSAQAERAGHIIRRIREFVKRSEPRRRRCRISGIVDDAVGFAEIEASKKRITIRTQVPADIADIDADPILIEQVLLNLIRNGCEATIDPMTDPTRDPRSSDAEAGRPRLIVVVARDVTVDAVSAEEGVMSDQVEFAVVDRGQGIAESLQDKLFEPFFSTKSEGMGMGLNICRSIVEFHGGRLWAAPNPDGGTIFRFTLPRAAGVAPLPERGRSALPA